MSEAVLLVIATGMISILSSLSITFLSHWLENISDNKLTKPRTKLLEQMLSDPNFQWRKLETLSHVIGADAQTTKRLLLGLKARASEDGQELWGLISRNPLPDRE